jgi:predicted nucleotidyltransferase
MDHDELKRRQKEILDRALKVLKNSNQVLGVIITGSYAHGHEDGFSDIDMKCYLNNEERIGMDILFNKVSEIALVLSKLFVYDKNALILFENGVRLDLDFCKPSEIAPEDKNKAKILYDPRGILEKGLGSKFSAILSSIKWDGKDGSLVDWFFWMFRQVYCWTKRAAQNDKRSFDKLNSAISSLNSIRDKLIEIRIWTIGKSGYLKEIDPDFAARLTNTYPRFNSSELLQATKLLLEEYKKIISVYCNKIGVIYPSEKIKTMEKLFSEFDQLS